MTEQKPKQHGKDFLMGFLPSLLLAIINVAILIISDDLMMLNVMFISGAILIIGAIVALIFRRPFIGAGMIAALVASPLLLLGSCFAISGFG